MLAAVSRFLPATATFFRQIVPPVIATLLAAVLIAAYNKTFSGHLTQPRMSALHGEANAADGATAPITTVGMTRPPAPPAPPVTETVTIYEEAIEPERLWEKDAKEEAGKDQAPIKLAAEPAPAPARTTSPTPKSEPRTEPHRVAAVELAQPVAPVARAPVPVIIAVPPAVVAPPTTAPLIAAMPMQEQRQPQYQPPYQPPQYQQPQYQPPPVVMGTPPMVTVPDRPVARPVQEAQAGPPAQPQGPIGTFADIFKPSNWFARAREFGQKIEDAGNEILPNIRQ